MAGPARAGLFLYAKDLQRVGQFYEAFLGLTLVHETAEIRVLESPDIQLVVHQIPPHIAATFTISTPPERREESALKFFFTGANIAKARTLAATLGGEVDAQQWQASSFIACNAIDPEGNIFQIRETAE